MNIKAKLKTSLESNTISNIAEPALNLFAFTDLNWLNQDFERLSKALLSERPPHGIIISGTQGLGKYLLAYELIKKLLCAQTQVSKYACGQCKSCIWLKNKSHPDYLEIDSQELNKPIKVDQIRLANDFFQLTAQNKQKIILINNAHLMNINASNSLLKTLEEPPSNGLIFLITNQPQQLAITIRSRAQHFNINPPKLNDGVSFLEKFSTTFDLKTAQESLQLTHLAPLLALKWQDEGRLTLQHNLMGYFIKALEDATNISVAADNLAKEAHLSIDLLCSWLRDALSLKLDSNAGVRHDSYRSQLLHLHQRHSLLLLSNQYQDLLVINQRLMTQTHIDWQLESWLMRF